MLNLSNLKLRERILLGYGVPLLLTVSATLGVIANARKVERLGIATSQGWELVQGTDRLELFMYKRQAIIRAYLLTGDEKFLQEYLEGTDNYNTLVRSLEDFVQISTAAQVRRLETMKAVSRTIYETNVEIANLRQAGNAEAAMRSFSEGRILGLVSDASQIFRSFNETEDALQAEREAEKREALQMLMFVAIAGSLTAAGVAIAIGFWLASRITQQVDAIASNISASSTEIAATVEQQERTAIQQSSSVNETTTTMDELSSSAQQSAQQAQTAAASAQTVLSLAGQGNQAVNHTLASMDALSARVSTVSEQILRLSEQTSQIGSISDLVANLANQTNMLALNAAVEAVRAGESGRGFAVVAAEIRKLADQSKQSAEKINMLVSSIQVALNSTVMATDESTKVAEQGTQVTQQTAVVFDQVSGAINNIVVSVQQISLNANQQAAAVQQVVKAMNDLNLSARDTASGISQTRVSTHQLNEAVQNLRAVV